MKNQTTITLLRYFKSVPKKMIFGSVFYASVRIFSSIAWPYLLFRQLFDKDEIDMRSFYWIIPAVLFLFAVSQIATLRQLMINVKIINSSTLELINELWGKMVSLEWLIFKKNSRAYYFDLFMSDCWRVRQGIMAILETILPYSVISISLLIFILYISPSIFILYSIGFILTSVLQLISNHKLRPAIRKYHAAWRKQSNNIGVSVDQFDLLRMDRGRVDSASKFYDETESFLKSNIEWLIAQSKWKIFIQVVIQLARIVVLIIGVYWIKIEIITWGEFFFTIFIIGIIQTNLSQLPSSINFLLEGLESLKKLNEFFQLKSEKGEIIKKRNTDIERINKIDIHDLTFAYTGKENIFNKYQLSLEKGKIYLWVGRNGCGKSTLSHLLLGLIQPDKGKIKINNKEISWDELRQIRSRFAFIHQDAILFASTIKDNITFGHNDKEKAWLDMKKSWLTTMLPFGKNIANRKIGERGEGLSGGEARRLVLIREWLHKAELIIFDEPLNHLDSQSIEQITKEILALKENAIVIIISHQSGFEKIADEVNHIDLRS